MNTMNPAFWRELDTVLTQLHRNADARALVISSTGKHFSAGMALEMFGGAITMDDQSAEGRAAIFDLLTEMQATFTKLETLRIPVIAAIQGGCIGGAVDMVTAACIRYATAGRLLLHPGDQHRHGGRRGHAAAPAQAHSAGVVKELAYTGRRLPADKALAYGLVNAVFDTPEALLAGAMACAQEIASEAADCHLGHQAGGELRPPTTRWKTACARWAGCRARSGAIRMCARR
jgi:enoyl-CoA hydratase